MYQVYLMPLNRSKAMEAVRDLRCGSGFVENTLKAHTGFAARTGSTREPSWVGLRRPETARIG